MFGLDTVQIGDLTMDEHVSGSLRQVIIDVKVGPPLFEFSLAADILSVVNETNCKNCLVWSKVDAVIDDLKALSAEVTMGYIVMKDPITGKTNDLFRMEGVAVVGVYYGLIDNKLVSDIHSVGKKVHAWTVNDRETMKRMLHERVDCIVTSYPTELQKVMIESMKQCEEEGFTI
eukprot:c24946_g1_i3 orf=676-1197(-)